MVVFVLVPKLSVALKRRVKVGNCLESGGIAIECNRAGPSLTPLICQNYWSNFPSAPAPADHYSSTPLAEPFWLSTHMPIFEESPAHWLNPRFPSAPAPADHHSSTPLTEPFWMSTHMPIFGESPAYWSNPRFPSAPAPADHFIQSLASNTIIYKKSRFWPRVSCLDFTLESRLSVSSGWGKGLYK